MQPPEFRRLESFFSLKLMMIVIERIVNHIRITLLSVIMISLTKRKFSLSFTNHNTSLLVYWWSLSRELNNYFDQNSLTDFVRIKNLIWLGYNDFLSSLNVSLSRALDSLMSRMFNDVIHTINIRFFIWKFLVSFVSL